MKQKNLMFVVAPFLGLAVLAANIVHADNLLTGDAKLACEAILCLSAGKTDGACRESYERYTGIHNWKHPDRVPGMRQNFLNMCPKQQSGGGNSNKQN